MARRAKSSGPEARPLLLGAIERARTEARALPAVWGESESALGRFSRDKELYAYQRDAVNNALWALWLYYEKCGDYRPDETPLEASRRKRRFALEIMRGGGEKINYALEPWLVHAHGGDDKERGADVFAALSERIRPEGGEIPFEALCNRMGFWMATGSGKTLVMVKLIENLRRLMEAGEIPERKILILAPGSLLLEQIHSTVAEYNRAARRPMDLVGLRAWNTLPGRGRDAIFYYDASNISDGRKQVRVDWRDFENNGEWYVLLDEAHRGTKGDSKRQAYYALFAREGFLFNFSATFADLMDVCTTGARFNLGDFIQEGYGKHICLCGSDFREFAARDDSRALNAFAKGEYGDEEKRRVVLKSALALALVKGEMRRLREKAETLGISPPYHEPLMVTMTHSVNTPRSDLAAYFNILAGLAAPGGIDAEEFALARQEFAEDLREGSFQFEDLGQRALRDLAKRAEKLTEADARRAVFLTESPGSLEIVKGESGKEIAIQLQTASEPFGLIRIGDTNKWIKSAEEAGIVTGETVRKESFFKGLETSRISALMGSRAFVESWDSTRPNVLNFVNIGTVKEAMKFIVQSIGRGVRVRPLPDRRRRLGMIKEEMTGQERGVFDDAIATTAAESLFVFAARRKAVAGALQGLAKEAASEDWVRLDGIFKLNPRPQLPGGREMPLLVPEYEEAKLPRERWREFRITKDSERRILDFVAPMPACVLAVAHEKSPAEIADFRTMTAEGNFWRVTENGQKFHSPDSAIRGVFDHLRIRAAGKKAESVRPLLTSDIVHFGHVKIRGGKDGKKILDGKLSGDMDERITKAEDEFSAGKISREEFRRIRREYAPDWETRFSDIVVRDLAEHYYTPLVMATGEKADYIRHIVKEESEVRFLEDLAKKMDSIGDGWEGWMFSKLDAGTDKVFIPYIADGTLHEFHPDFVFWMCRGDEYRIVFVDPKGMAHADSYRKLDGYAELFKKGENLRVFERKEWRKVTVSLLFYNADAANAPKQYRGYWTNTPSKIFAD